MTKFLSRTGGGSGKGLVVLDQQGNETSKKLIPLVKAKLVKVRCDYNSGNGSLSVDVVPARGYKPLQVHTSGGSMVIGEARQGDGVFQKARGVNRRKDEVMGRWNVGDGVV